MKFTVERKKLLKVLTSVGKVINEKAALPILSNYKVELLNDRLYITGSNMDSTIQANLEAAASEGNGSLCLNAKKIKEMVAKAAGESIDFVVDEDSLETKIIYQGGRYVISGLPDMEYPQIIPVGDELIRTQLSSDVLQKGLNNVGWAAGVDEYRPMCMGTHIDLSTDGMTFVATDTQVLAKYFTAESACENEYSFTIPTPGVKLLQEMLQYDKSITLIGYGKGLAIEAESFRIFVPLLVARYPDYNRVIPSQFISEFAVDRMALLSATERMILCAGDHGLLKLVLDEGKITLSATDYCYNKHGEEALLCGYNGESTPIGISGELLSRMLSSINTTNIDVKVTSADRPIVVVPTIDGEGEKGQLTFLIMPMVLTNA